jgi:hypothetical protein
VLGKSEPVQYCPAFPKASDAVIDDLEKYIPAESPYWYWGHQLQNLEDKLELCL